MWSQHFNFWCDERSVRRGVRSIIAGGDTFAGTGSAHLFTLYADLAGEKTLAVNWQEKGSHSGVARGADFQVALTEEEVFGWSLPAPSQLRRFGWKGLEWVEGEQWYD